MNATGDYHGPPGEQGDPLEASLAYGVGIYANGLLPSGIAKNTAVISKRMIEGHGCTPLDRRPKERLEKWRSHARPRLPWLPAACPKTHTNVYIE